MTGHEKLVDLTEPVESPEAFMTRLAKINSIQELEEFLRRQITISHENNDIDCLNQKEKIKELHTGCEEFTKEELELIKSNPTTLLRSARRNGITGKLGLRECAVRIVIDDLLSKKTFDKPLDVEKDYKIKDS